MGFFLTKSTPSYRHAASIASCDRAGAASAVLKIAPCDHTGTATAVVAPSADTETTLFSSDPSSYVLP